VCDPVPQKIGPHDNVYTLQMFAIMKHRDSKKTWKCNFNKINIAHKYSKVIEVIEEQIIKSNRRQK